VAFASESRNTGGATYNSPNKKVDQDFIDFLNDQKYIDHSHQFDCDRENQAGVGVDVIVWESAKEDATVKSVEIQEKYDFANEENAVYAVAKINVWKFLKKKEKPVETVPAQ
jgi:hypothetical protein